MLDDIGPQIIPHLIGIPVGGGEQALDPVGGGGTHVLSDLPAILAFNGTDERAQVVVRLLAGVGPDKVLGDALVQGRQADRPTTNLCNIEVFAHHVITLLCG